MENKNIPIPFSVQYDKIVGAYLRNELKPWDSCACFVGNLLNNTFEWGCGRASAVLIISSAYSVKEESKGMYSFGDICDLEDMFLSKIVDNEDDENSLFEAMESTLQMLKKIHEKLGEVIKPYNFQKRTLQTA